MEQEFSRQNFFQNFRKEIFLELTKSLEAKQCAQSIFIQKFERLDLEYLNSTNVFQYHVD